MGFSSLEPQRKKRKSSKAEEVFYLPTLIRQIPDDPDDQLRLLFLLCYPENMETLRELLLSIFSARSACVWLSCSFVDGIFRHSMKTRADGRTSVALLQPSVHRFTAAKLSQEVYSKPFYRG
jgi:hypothetical protein